MDRSAPPPVRRERGRALLAFALAAHAFVVASVLSQPLDVRRAAPERRALLSGLFNDAVHRIGPAGDFFAVYRAGVQVRAGRSAFSGAEDPRNPPYGYAYRYLPALAQTLGRALTLLPPRAAWVAWGLACEALLAVFLALWWRAVPSPRERAAGTALLLASTPYFLELHMGQFTFATCALACGALLLFERARGRAARALASLMLAAGALLKLVPLVVLPALRRVRAARRGWAFAALLVAAPLAWHAFASPVDLARLGRANVDELSPGMQRGNFGMLYTLTAAAREAGVEWTRERFVPLARAWQALVLGATAALAWRAPARALALGGAALLAAFFVAYQHVWEHHYSGALVAGLLVARGVAASGGGRASRALAWLALAALAAPTPFAWLAGRADPTWQSWPGWQQWAVPLSKSGPLLALWGLALAALVRERRSAAPRAAGEPRA
jgi:hypothetical protein